MITITTNASIVGWSNVCTAKFGTLKLQPGVDNPQRSGHQYIYNTYRQGGDETEKTTQRKEEKKTS